MVVQGVAGFFIFIGIAFLLSEDKKNVSKKIILTGILIQLTLAVVMLKLPVFKDFFIGLNSLVLSLEESTRAGTSMVFGYLGGGDLPFDEKFPGAAYIFAFRGLPLIIFISAISSLLFYWKILPLVVKGFSFALQRTMGIGGAEGLGVSANIFVGMVEAPLFIRPYMKNITRSELFTLMATGMATIAGSVMILYASILSNTIPNVLGHILTASIISAPAAIMIAKIMVPETKPVTQAELSSPEPLSSSMDAITKGTGQGLHLFLNVIAMLIVFVGLVHLANLCLGVFPAIGGSEITLQRILGVMMAPIVWLMGIPASEAVVAGGLLGTKSILNEFVAYLELAKLSPGAISEKSKLIMTYAMCGFANPGSLGIMIGGLGTMAPERRDEIVSLGFRAIIAGTLATCLTGALVGILT